MAPVISTAAAAAAAAGKSKVNYSRQKVALDVAGGIQKLHPLARDEGGGLYLYEQGVYRLDDVAMRLRASIESEVLATYGEDYLDLHMEKEVLHRLTVQARVLPPAPPPGWLHVLNGRVNVRTGDLEPHSPDHGSTTLLPIVYDPAARCPAIERFCLQVFPADAMDLGVPWQVVALCALPLRGVDKAILLLGPGENGKGVFLDIVQAFVGVENASHVSLQSIAGDKYATADLRGKVLNLCSDLPSRVLDDSGDFKAIVSGEKIRAQRKNKDAFAFAPYCRLLFSANNLPESGDTSTGFFRRWYMIPFSVSFAPGNPLRRPRGELVAELTTPMELSGLLNLALVQMRRFMAGDPPDSSPSMDEAVEEFVAISDPFPSWLEAAVRAAPQAGPMAWIETAEVIRRYRERYERRGRWQPISPQAAGAAILARFPNAVRTRKRVGGSGQAAGTTGKQRWGWQGVEWRDPFRNGTP